MSSYAQRRAKRRKAMQRRLKRRADAKQAAMVACRLGNHADSERQYHTEIESNNGPFFTMKVVCTCLRCNTVISSK